MYGVITDSRHPMTVRESDATSARQINSRGRKGKTGGNYTHEEPFAVFDHGRSRRWDVELREINKYINK